MIVGSKVQQGAVSQTYSAADATEFGGIIVATGAESLFISRSTSTFFPANRPLQILVDGYRWEKPVPGSSVVIKLASIAMPGVYVSNGVMSGDMSSFVK
jgi:catalase